MILARHSCCDRTDSFLVHRIRLYGQCYSCCLLLFLKLVILLNSPNDSAAAPDIPPGVFGNVHLEEVDEVELARTESVRVIFFIEGDFICLPFRVSPHKPSNSVGEFRRIKRGIYSGFAITIHPPCPNISRTHPACSDAC